MQKHGAAAKRAGRLAGLAGLAAVLAVLTAAAAPARANEDPAFVKLSAGYIGDIVADREAGGYFSFEYRAGPELELFHIRPSLGVAAVTNASVYGWLGANLDIFFGKRLVLTPTTGIGAYGEGDGQDLGSTLVFRNGVELGWRLDNRARLGLGFHYLSNYGIGDDDPGIASLTLFYAHPLGKLLP